MLEKEMRAGLEIIRRRGYIAVMVTESAVIDGVPDEYGKLPENTNLGAGLEPGESVIAVTRDGGKTWRRFREAFFLGAGTGNEMADRMEADLP